MYGHLFHWEDREIKYMEIAYMAFTALITLGILVAGYLLL
jgi:hypothetical protein